MLGTSPQHRRDKEPTMAIPQRDKAEAFRALHRSGCFVIPNPWDAGSARALAGLGFEALATSSGAAAAVLGRRDGELTRDEALAHARAIVEATDLPVAADLENGFGDAPADAALTIRLAGDCGLVGGSIEDAAGVSQRRLYDFKHAVERVAAAVEAARALPFPFTLTARCENFLRGNPDLDDTIARLQAYDKAGAGVLFAPALPDLAAVRAVCAAVAKPVNFMVGMKGRSFSVAELRDAGVRRISLATSLYRAAMAGMLQAATEVRQQGSFGYVEKL
jgi:2-methylisocitrate lyase-like PEP mutase family enzyme